jgi:HAD superfamily hydrolase (TIGR01509 family)
MAKMTPEQRRKAEKILNDHEEKAVIESKLNNGAEKTLSNLRAAGIHIGILTRNKRSNAYAIARKHNLNFDSVIGREDGPVKPDAFGVLQLCRQFGVEPKETLLVGDYLFDLLCAKAAGAFAVLLANHLQADDFAEHGFLHKNITNTQIIANKNNKARRGAKERQPNEPQDMTKLLIVLRGRYQPGRCTEASIINNRKIQKTIP